MRLPFCHYFLVLVNFGKLFCKTSCRPVCDVHGKVHNNCWVVLMACLSQTIFGHTNLIYIAQQQNVHHSRIIRMSVTELGHIKCD